MTIVAVPIALPISAPQIYNRYGVGDPVSLQILEEIRKTMAAIPDVVWADFWESSLFVSGFATPCITIRQTGNPHTGDESCHTSLDELLIEIDFIMELVHESRQAARWREALSQYLLLIEQAVRANRSWGGLARGTQIESRSIYDPVEDLVSCALSIRVSYGTAANDLTIPA